MGDYIRVFAEKKHESGHRTTIDILFEHQNYNMFAFLGNFHNRAKVPFLSSEKDFPKDVSDDVRTEFDLYSLDAHSKSWIDAKELLEFDYDKTFENRQKDDGETVEEGQGKEMTFREFLGEQFFESLFKLKESGVDRIVFWFE